LTDAQGKDNSRRFNRCFGKSREIRALSRNCSRLNKLQARKQTSVVLLFSFADMGRWLPGFCAPFSVPFPISCAGKRMFKIKRPAQGQKEEK